MTLQGHWQEIVLATFWLIIMVFYLWWLFTRWCEGCPYRRVCGAAIDEQHRTIKRDNQQVMNYTEEDLMR